MCPCALLDLHMLESRLREEKEEEFVLIKAKCGLINTHVQVKMCRRVLLPYWCMGEQHVNLHQAKRNQERWFAFRRWRSSSSTSSGLSARQRYDLDRVFSFTGLMLLVERPGYRLDSRTIKRGSRPNISIVLS